MRATEKSSALCSIQWHVPMFGILEVEAEGSEVQGHRCLHCEFQTSLLF